MDVLYACTVEVKKHVNLKSNREMDSPDSKMCWLKLFL
jgi:hypothetical protein